MNEVRRGRKRKCKHCGLSFLEKVKTQKYCSKECKKKNADKRRWLKIKKRNKSLNYIKKRKCKWCKE